MQKIFLRFHHIPSEDLAKMVLANKKKSGLLHFEELEKMAQEIAEELLMDLMKFTMGDKSVLGWQETMKITINLLGQNLPTLIR